MGLFRAGSKLIFFVHIPKTGGTSVETALQAHGARQALFWPGSANYATRCSFHHFHAKAYEKLVTAEFCDYAFMVVRNPYARLISEYCWQLRGANLPKTITADYFDHWLSWCLAKTEKDNFFYDNHFRRQWEFANSWVEVFKLEDGLEAPIRQAIGQLGLAWKGGETPRDKLSVWPQVQLARKTYDRFLDYYMRDFEQFGYDPQLIPPQLKIVPTPAFYSLSRKIFATLTDRRVRKGRDERRQQRRKAAGQQP